MPIPEVRKKERTRTKKGRWRHKRSDVGIRRVNRKEVGSNDAVGINKDHIGIDWYVVYDWLLHNPNAGDVEFVEYMEKIQNELIVIDNPNDASALAISHGCQRRTAQLPLRKREHERKEPL